MTDELKAEREAFEKWWAENFSYVNEKLASLNRYAWYAWQARAQLDRTHTTGGMGMSDQTFRKIKILAHLLLQAFRDWKENVSRKDLDSVYCCNGRECGCGAITIGEVYGEKEYA